MTPLFHVLGCLLAAALGTQDPAVPTETQQAKQTPPSLDELLGLDDVEDNAAEQAARQNQEELERRLSDVELGDVFDVALAKMEISADLLDGELDSGLGTQRVQQDILARLDELIDIAKQMSQQQMSSSSGGSGQSKPKPGAGQQQGGGQRSQSGNQDGQSVELPPGQEGDINTIIEETGSEWGHLPERLREMLEQAQKSHSSALYRELTEQYYKRLAEEGSP